MNPITGIESNGCMAAGYPFLCPESRGTADWRIEDGSERESGDYGVEFGFRWVSGSHRDVKRMRGERIDATLIVETISGVFCEAVERQISSELCNILYERKRILSQVRIRFLFSLGIISWRFSPLSELAGEING